MAGCENVPLWKWINAPSSFYICTFQSQAPKTQLWTRNVMKTTSFHADDVGGCCAPCNLRLRLVQSNMLCLFMQLDSIWSESTIIVHEVVPVWKTHSFISVFSPIVFGLALFIDFHWLFAWYVPVNLIYNALNELEVIHNSHTHYVHV